MFERIIARAAKLKSETASRTRSTRRPKSTTKDRQKTENSLADQGISAKSVRSAPQRTPRTRRRLKEKL
jgi:hypothetical protein